MARPGPVCAATWDALRRRGRHLAKLAGWSAAEALPALLAGLLTAQAVDRGFLAGRPLTGLAWLAGLVVAIAVGSVGTARAYTCLGDIVEPFRDDLARLVVTGALRSSTRPGARCDTGAVARLTHQVEIVRDTMAGLIMVVRGFLFAATAALLGLLSLAPLAAILVAGPLLAGLAIFVAALPALVAWQRAYVVSDERLGAEATAALAGQRDIVACGGQRTVTTAVGGRVNEQARIERGLARMAAVRSLSLAVGGWLPLAALVVAAPWLVRRGLTTGEILGALVYVSAGVQPALRSLVQGVATGGVRFVVTLERVLAGPAIDADRDPGPAGPTPRRDPADPAPGLADPTPPRGPGDPASGGGPADGGRPTPHRPGPAGTASAARLNRVTFRYGPHARPVLDDLELRVPAGDHLVIVGPSGAGKSTLAGLLAGTLTPQRGAVLVGGRPVAGLDARELAALRVLIPQEAYVFRGTLEENLRYLCPDVPEAALWRAVEALGLGALTERLGGLAAPVEPGRLSAGERQLVAAARAYLAPAPLAILDEATCHLDPASEARVERAFARRSGTLVVIAHRISSALRARHVMILDGSPLVGTHDSLLAASAGYRDLVGHWSSGPDEHEPATVAAGSTSEPDAGRARPTAEPAAVAGPAAAPDAG